MTVSSFRTCGSLGSPHDGLSVALGSFGLFVALDSFECLVVDMCILGWVAGGAGGWVVEWMDGKVGERVGDIPVDRLGAPGGISVVPVRLGVPWGGV